MKIVIMRHGDAVFGADDDAARSLTEAGRQQNKAMAEWLQAQLPDIRRVLVSPYLRAQQTWQCISDRFPQAKVETCADLVPHGKATAVVNHLLALEADGLDTLVISHLPLVGYLVAELCPGVTPPMFATSAMAGIELSEAHGKLLWQMSPHQLKSM